jgi:hypothetical protein
MRITHLICWLSLASLPGALAAEINGTVRKAAGQTATIVTDSELLPTAGDKVEIYFKMPGLDEEISVASGHVVEVVADSINVEIESATGEVNKDQLARITSEKPQKRTSSSTPLPPQEAPPTAVATPSASMEAVERFVNFDSLPRGPLPADAFGDRGVRFVQGKGAPIVAEAERNMVLPKGRKQVLLVSGDRVTSVTMTFKKPLKRFALTRIGTAGGASVPTWTLDAYDSEGKVVGSAGEEHGLPPKPQQFSIEGDGIVRVQLSTDNRFGSGTWATWNSLPVTEFEIER